MANMSMTEVARRNTIQAWQRIARRYGVLSSVEVADRLCLKGLHGSELSDDWVKAGRLLAVRRVDGSLEIPGFQFANDGTPLPVVADVLHQFRAAGWSDLSIAIWAAAPSGWLADRAPADVWSDPSMVDAVRHAALQDALG